MAIISSKVHKSTTFRELHPGDTVWYYIMPLKYVERIKNGTKYSIEAHPVKISYIADYTKQGHLMTVYFDSSFTVRSIVAIGNQSSRVTFANGFSNSELIMGCYIDDVPSKEEFVKEALKLYETDAAGN